MPKEIWSFIEIENEKLHRTALKMAAEAVREAKLLKGTPCGLLFGHLSSMDLLEEISNYGLEKIYVINAGEDISPEATAGNLSSFISEISPELVLFASTPVGTEIGARIAAKLKKGFISNCVDFEFTKGKLGARKPLYEGKAHGYYTWRTDAPYLATVNVNSIEALKSDKKIRPEIIKKKITEVKSRSILAKRWEVPLSELDIAEARLVIGVGNGVDQQKFMARIERLAELLGGVIGGTRVAVFKGLIPVEKQIGSTGKFINADIYLPIGISGSNRHTSAIRNVLHVIPININKEAPIFKFAELGIVNDLYKVVPSLIEIFAKEKETAGGSK